LRLLLAAKPYAACKGGATVLTTYLALNETNLRVQTYYIADYVRIWQVCKLTTKDFDWRIFFFKRE
jgi:hypothetical protein